MNYKRRRPRTQPGGCWCKLEKILQEPKAKEIEAPEEPLPHRSRKDRKRWCGGHVGREHRPLWLEEPGWRQRFPAARATFEHLTCERCGKKMGYRRRCLGCGEVFKGWQHGCRRGRAA